MYCTYCIVAQLTHRRHRVDGGTNEFFDFYHIKVWQLPNNICTNLSTYHVPELHIPELQQCQVQCNRRLRREWMSAVQQSRGCGCKWFNSLQKLVEQTGEHNRISLIGLEFEECRRYQAFVLQRACPLSYIWRMRQHT